MKRINLGRVILGGLVAGVLINISEYVLNTIVLKADMDAAMKAIGKTVPMSGGTIAGWVFRGFAMGIASVWLYAAIRPRYGAGAATAARAAVFVWLLSCVVCNVIIVNMNLLPLNFVLVGWELVQGILATMLGAWLYRENGAASVT